MEQPYRHIVVFRLPEEADVDEVVARLRALGDAPQVLSWRVERSLDERKGPVVVEVGLFASAQAFVVWRDSPAHQATAEHLREVADWLVADYLD
ncbi:MAG: Dabb family protein [Actinomycetota bacterium]|nr:Dabb family protein [Actinomycetota bacterium]